MHRRRGGGAIESSPLGCLHDQEFRVIRIRQHLAHVRLVQYVSREQALSQGREVVGAHACANEQSSSLVTWLAE